MSAEYKISDSDFGECDWYEPRFASWEVSGSGDTIVEFIDGIELSIIDQDGEHLDTTDFWNADTGLQNKILNNVGLTWAEVNAAFDIKEGA